MTLGDAWIEDGVENDQLLIKAVSGGGCCALTQAAQSGRGGRRSSESSPEGSPGRVRDGLVPLLLDPELREKRVETRL